MTTIDEILARYAFLLREAEEKCEEVYKNAPEIPCKNKCYECCQQLFPLTFVEAFYISGGFKKLDRGTRRELQKTAKKISGKILKRNPFQFEKSGVDRKTALNTHAEFARFLQEDASFGRINCLAEPRLGLEEKFNCPALEINKNSGKNSTGNCALYEFRNLDCRVMGCSFDKSAGEIVGCYRFSKLGHLIPKLLPFNYKYSEKMELDRALISAVTDRAFNQNIFYLTTMCGPILKDYAEADWMKFFSEKTRISHVDSGEYYYVIID